MADAIRIMKKEKKKNAFVISVETIEEMAATYPNIGKAIQYDGQGEFSLDSVEMGHFGNKARVNDVVAFEEVNTSKQCPIGYNLWSMGTQEKASQRVSIKSNTEIYTKATIDEAIFFDNNNDVLAFIEARTTSEFFNEKVSISDGIITIQTKYGDAKGQVGQCYIISHGIDRIQVLTIGTPSIDDFYVIDSEDKIITELSKLH